MKRAILAAALLALLAPTAVLAAPPSPPATTWFYDGFEGTLNCGGGYCYTPLASWPHWGGTSCYEWGALNWGNGTADLCVRHLLSATDPVKLNACAGDNYVSWMGINNSQPHDGTIVGKAVQTQTTYATGIPPSPIGWGAAQDVPPGAAAGGYDVQVLHCKIRRPGGNDAGEMVNPWYHAGIYLIDNAPPSTSNHVIMGWEGGSTFIRSQVHLPASGQTVVEEGDDWTFYIGGAYDNTCHVFDAYYYPKAANGRTAGTVEFFVDGEQLPTVLNAGANRIGNSVYVRDFINQTAGNWKTGDPMALDELYVGTTETPVVTYPVGNSLIVGDKPTITWTHAYPSGMTGYQVRVRASGVPTGTSVYNTGEVAGSTTSHTVTTSLPLNTHLWAFVREKYDTRWTPWSMWDLAATSGFTITTAGPPVVSVSSPIGTTKGLRPPVVFEGSPHTKFEVKITTTSDGSGTAVWDSGEITSMKWGASCPVTLALGTQYYAFARAYNGDGWGNWSAASPFTMTRAGEGTDYRGMDEKWGSQNVYYHDAPAPDDGFSREMGDVDPFIKWQVLPDPFNATVDENGVNPNGAPCDWWPTPGPDGWIKYDPGVFIIPPQPDRAAPSYIYSLWDVGYGLSDCSMKQHKILNLSLDNGVTFMTYARGQCYEGSGCGGWELSSRSIAQQASIYICDDYGTGKCMASFRYGQSQAGICNDAATWKLGYYSDNQQPDRPGQGWHVVRITGRNQIIGDPTTTVWNFYLDENPIPLVTTETPTPHRGSMDQSIAPALASGPITDCIGIGLATGGMVGKWDWDWTAVNTDGDFAPGEWTGGGTFATVSEARAARVTGPCTITGNTVITAVMRDEDGFQLGFSVQDVDTQDHAGMFIYSSLSTNIAVGNKVNGISGNASSETGRGLVMGNATFTASTDTAAVPPLAMPQKSLRGFGHAAALGTENGGMFVRITGRVKAIVSPTSTGAQAVYFDDGCGLIDGRSTDGNPSATGVRVLFRDPSQPFLGEVGKFYRIDGICTCETWTEGAVTKTVETLLGAKAEEIPEP